MNLNKSMFTGNVTRDPELKYSGNGTAILNLGIAINNSYKDQAGEWVEKTCFMDVTIFGKSAEYAKEKVSKGVHIFIEGSLHQDEWVDKNTGQKRYKHYIKADRVSLTQRGQSSNSAPSGYQPPQQRNEAPQPTQEPPPMTYQDENGDDIPF